MAREKTHQDFPTELGDLTATQYTQLLDLFKDQHEKLKSNRDRLDERREEADRDELTGLYNRRGLDRRTRGRDWGYWVVCDLNGFKTAQDSHPDGHAYGDRILVEFTAWLLETSRRDDIVGRSGGDEFAIWVETRQGALRLRNAVREWVSRDDAVACAAGLGDTLESADAALYMHKKTIREQEEAEEQGL